MRKLTSDPSSSDQVDPPCFLEGRVLPEDQAKADGDNHWVRRAFSAIEDDAKSFNNNKQWAKAGENLDPDDRLWKQYQVLVDLYKYYLDVAWKVAVWYYATTGVVLAFYFNNMDDTSTRRAYLPLLLLFIAGISVAFAYLHWRGARDIKTVPKWLEHIADELRLPGRPHVEFAVVFLLINAAMFVAVSLGCVIVFFLTL